MKLSVTGRHLTVPGPIRQLVEKKLARVERTLGESAVSAQVVIAKERQVIVCDLTVHARADHMLHAVGRHADMETAVAEAVARLATQAERLADRWKKRRKNGGRLPMPAEAEGTVATQAVRVIRTRRYVIKPLSLEDAVLELSAGDLNFLVFRQAPAETVAVLYRRPDGHYGLIEPEA